jgi:hypothetical protein
MYDDICNNYNMLLGQIFNKVIINKVLKANVQQRIRDQNYSEIAKQNYSGKYITAHR